MSAAPISLAEFVRDYCKGREYDSCANSPCLYSNPSGCQHPMHPRNGHPSHLMVGEFALDQKPAGVLVTYPDGCTRMVAAAVLRREAIFSILKAAAEPRPCHV